MRSEVKFFRTKLDPQSNQTGGVRVVGKRTWIMERFERIFQNSTSQLHIRPPFLMEHGEVGKFFPTKIFPTSLGTRQQLGTRKQSCAWIAYRPISMNHY